MDKIKRITRADVAKEANVSETIVSYVINANRYVAEDKKKRVLAAIKKLHYRPNKIARALKGKKSNQILFITDSIMDEHFARLINEMDKFAYKDKFLISLCGDRNDQEFVLQILSHQYDGIIISSSDFKYEYIKSFTDYGIPVILFKRSVNDSEILKDTEGIILIDSGLYSGTRKLVNYFIKKGRKNIVFIDSVSEASFKSRRKDLRISGFIDEMKANHLEISENSILGFTNSEDRLKDLLVNHISEKKIDAVVARNDRYACIAIEEIKKLGLKVPEDIAVAGFDNSTLSKYTNPCLTSIEIDRKNISKKIISLLKEGFDEEAVKEISFNTKLIERNSTRI